MPRAGFEPTIPVFERSKTVRAAIGTGQWIKSEIKLFDNKGKEQNELA
jgi:hypothetical protein